MYRRAVAFGFAAAVVSSACWAEDVPTYRPSPGSQPPLPVIRKAPPVGAQCAPYNEALTIARMGREREASPAFTTKSAPLSTAFFGAPTCTGSVSSEGGNGVNCPMTGKDDAWAVATMNQRVVAATTCFSGWRRNVSERYATFTSVDGTMNLTFARPDPVYGPMVDTTARYQPCEPLQEMMGLARHGRRLASEPQYTAVPTALLMRYYGADSCSAKALDTAGSFAVSCVYAAADKAAAARSVAEGAATIQACQPAWTRSDTPQGATFVKGDGIEISIASSGERQAAFTMTFTPKAK